MTDREVDGLLRSFQRRMAASAALRWILVVGVTLCFVVADWPWVPQSAAAAAGGGLVLGMLLWLLMIVLSLRTVRAARWGAALLAGGRIDEAQRELIAAVRSFSLFRSTMLLSFQQLGATLCAQQQYAGARRVFRAILSYTRRWLGRARSFETAVRLMLADVELALGDPQGAYEAFQPVFGRTLSLGERLMLLPIELRYEMATGQTASAVANLADKVRHAELLDAPRAAWVHSVLAEACRREGLLKQSEFLQRRAALYHEPADDSEPMGPISFDPTTGAVQ